jgi:hypothetical protein
MIQLNRGRSRTTTDEYGRRIAVLHDEIFKLEQVLEAPPVDGDVGASEVAVRRLRASIVHEELVRKRAEFESLATEARATGVDVEQAIAAPRANARSVTVPVPSAPGGTKRRRPVVMVAVAGLLILLIGLPAARFTGLLGGEQAARRAGSAGLAAPLADPLELAPLIATSAVAQRGETFYTTGLEITFNRGRLFLAGDPPPTNSFTVDDGMRLEVTRPDGTTATWSHNFNTGCIRNEPLPAQDVTKVFQPGVNRIAVTLYDICGSSKGSEAPIWLVNQD